MKIKFQYVFSKLWGKKINCRAANQSIGINPSGVVSSCFWALDKKGLPLQDFIIGNVPSQNIDDILSSGKAEKWKCNSSKRESCILLEPSP